MNSVLPPSRSLLRLILLAAVLVTGWTIWGAGCEQPEMRDDVTAPPREPEPPAQPPPITDPDAPEPTPAELAGFHVGAWEYVVTAGEDEGELVRFDLQEAPDDEAMPWRRVRKDGRVEHLGLGDDGSVLLGAVEDVEHEVITSYEPPLTLIPAEMSRGSEQTFEVQMTVRNIEPPHRVRSRGDARRTVHYVRDEVIESPVGDFVSKRIEASYRGSMTLATVTIEAVEWYSGEVGMVAEQVDQRVRAALLFGESFQQTITLNALPENGISE